MSTTYAISDAFVNLQRRFPLRPIKSEQEYEDATAALDDLFGRNDLDEDHQNYVDTLLLLIGSYEQEQHAIDASDRTPADALRFLMEANDMKQADLVRFLGCSQSAASMMMSGQRGIAREHAKRLAERFKVDVSLFL
jgi:HTH-type transcriptional regulator/antitoxin HigA